MTKNKQRDAQILLKVLMCQKSIEKVQDTFKCEDGDACMANELVVDLMHFYMLKAASLMKGLSKKTYEQVDSVCNTFKDTILTEAIKYAYPTTSAKTIVDYALDFADYSNQLEVKEAYTKCVGEQ